MDINRFQDAVILVDKPVGRTSFETIAILKRLLNVKKIGHSGTLDRFASGLLVVCTGSATKLTRFFLESDKRYIGVVKLGVSTDTNDIEGNILETKSTENITTEDITKLVAGIRGEILQKPPVFSALKVNGKRASDLARNEKRVNLKERKVFIYNIDIVDFDLENARFTIDVISSKGTYIRSIARDIGEVLETGAYLESLKRMNVGHFSIEQTATLEEIHDFISGRELNKCFILKPVEALKGFSEIVIKNEIRGRVLNGAYFKIEDVLDINENKKKKFIIVDEKKNLIAIADIDIEKWHIKYLNVFNN